MYRLTNHKLCEQGFHCTTKMLLSSPVSKSFSTGQLGAPFHSPSTRNLILYLPYSWNAC